MEQKQKKLEKTKIRLDKLAAERDRVREQYVHTIQASKETAEAARMDMAAAMEAGDLKAYQAAKNKRQDALDNAEMTEGRLATMKADLVTWEEGQTIRHEIEEETAELRAGIAADIKEKIRAVAEGLAEIIRIEEAAGSFLEWVDGNVVSLAAPEENYVHSIHSYRDGLKPVLLLQTSVNAKLDNYGSIEKRI